MTMEIIEESGQAYETARNLRRQLKGLEDTGQADFVFQDTSPPRKYIMLYSMEDGSSFKCPSFRVNGYMEQSLPDGRDRWTTDKNAAPIYVLGSVKCYFARGSEHRDLIDKLNIAPGFYCPAEHLGSLLSAEIHAEHRHPTRWRMLKRELDRIEQESWRAEQRQANENMVALARAATGARTTVAVSEELPCSQCDFTAKNNFGLQAHIRGKHRKE